MDWFERLTGFRETGYAATRANLEVRDDRLHSLVNGASHGIGRFELVFLHALRERARSAGARAGRQKVSVVTGDVRAMHREPGHAGALFQVASQFNMLEMTGPSVTPEHGVTRYHADRTQGPACAIAAGAATIWRNYFVPLDGGFGQTATRQLDGLATLGEALAAALGVPVASLWQMQNGYALASRDGLDRITGHLAALDSAQLDDLRGRLAIGLHWDVEATEAAIGRRPVVSQAFCSALPVAYSGINAEGWARFACLVLEAAYEATMWAAVVNATRGRSNVVFLTFLGGGAFGNEEAWIHAALRRALKPVAGYELDVRLVCYGSVPDSVRRLADDFT